MRKKTPLLPTIGTTITVRFAEDEGLAPVCDAFVVRADADAIIARFNGEVDAAGKLAELCYASSNGDLLTVVAYAESLSGLDASHVVLRVQNRESFRVRPRKDGILCDSSDERGCPVVDIGFRGIAILFSTEAEVGQSFKLRLRVGGRVQHGAFVVRNVRQAGSRFRYGMEAKEDQAGLIHWLSEQVMRIQRLRLSQRIEITEARSDSCNEPARAAANDAVDVVVGKETMDAMDAVETLLDDGGVVVSAIQCDTLVDDPLAASMLDDNGEPIFDGALIIDEATGAALEDQEVCAESESGLCKQQTEVFADADEQRGFRRRSFCTSGVAQIVSEHDRRTLKIKMIDISRGGMCFRAGSLIQEGTPVILLLSTAKSTAWIFASVVYSRLNEGSEKGFRVGVRFLQSRLQSLM